MRKSSRATGALCVLAVSLAAAPTAAELPEKKLSVTPVADGVYAALWTEPLRDPIEGNSLFIVNDDDVVVVDSALFPSSTRRMIAALREITPKPVRYVINTHWHDDHHDGNFVYRETWP